jgi:radical SAM superfamily enzyme YgiQ (UPF0313 family)
MTPPMSRFATLPPVWQFTSMHSRPVWLLSMDTEQFHAPPMTTGALKAFFLKNGSSAAQTEIDLVHFLERQDADTWLEKTWPEEIRPLAAAAAARGEQPILGLSCYTWNVAEFLDIATRAKQDVPELLVIAGGPHVQRAEDFLLDEAIDLIILGEGEITFTELLDQPRSQWQKIEGLAWLEDGVVRQTPTRPRREALDEFPSALDVIELRNASGEPIYEQMSYETARGCPYRCAFCEWGTGAIGTKMYQFSLDRIRSDFERAAAGGIKDFWLADSNFGALREDAEKTEIVIDLRKRTGLPQTFATSWSKNHNKRVQGIVRRLHEESLLSHYHLALQTLTPLALELSNRKNMRDNDYERVVKACANEGIPIAAELIWGLPGDTLPEFETNLDRLLRVFPNINIFGYTLLPGTEFYDRREEYQLETIPVAGYGKAKGEYVVGCHTFSPEEGAEGYFLITAYIVLARGQILPLTAQFLALDESVPVAPLLRRTLAALLDEFSEELGEIKGDQLLAYERRSDIYLALLAKPERTYAVIARVLSEWLDQHDCQHLTQRLVRILGLDRALCPRSGSAHLATHEFEFDAAEALATLSRMERPSDQMVDHSSPSAIEIEYPGGVGEVLHDPDGGSWVRGQLRTHS